MTTDPTDPHATPDPNDAPLEHARPQDDDGLCDVCQERRARWQTLGHGSDFRICDPCRIAEPCARCAMHADDCACPGGPDVFAWVPVSGRR